MALYCRICLYDLSQTYESRCPECGCAFNRESASTTLPSPSRLGWAWHHIERLMIEGWSAGRGTRHKYCRSCFADLQKVLENRCPVCNRQFNHKDSTTFCRSNDAITRLLERFGHVAWWRGFVIAIVVLVVGVHSIVTQHTYLPGAGRAYSSVGMQELNGVPAVVMGVGWLGAAIALHSHFFWGRVEPIWRIAGIGTIAGILMIIGGWGGAFVLSIKSILY